MERNLTQLSKFLSLVLRHKPDEIGLTLDPNGWVNVAELIEAVSKSGRPVDTATLEKIVEQSDKQRFAFNVNRTRIRANQGHSVNVELNLEEKMPPEFLFHGTAMQNVESIRAEGLKKQERHHVHLSANREAAESVGRRYGKPVVLIVRAGEMSRGGYKFFQSENGVWLVNHVPTSYIDWGES
jgi:putative RNA 2'-phosphotransferase